jgi:hypothetical protein
MGRRSPYLRTPEASSAPARLAQESNGEAWWRPVAEGGVEVATLRDGEFRRHRVKDDEGVMLVDRLPPTTLQCRGMRVMLTGWLLCLASILAGGLAAERWNGLAPLAVGGFAVGFVLFWVGGHASARASDVGERLKWMKETTCGWNVAPELDTWQPATTAQLRALEDIADDYGGVAYVRGDQLRVVEVLARRGLRVHRLWVDDLGNRGVTSIGARTLRRLSAHVRQVEGRGETWHFVKTAVPPEE